MSNTIGIINYGTAGNVFSIKKALKRAGADVIIIESKKQIARVDKIILPGVGSFKDAISELKSDGLFETLRENILEKPTLGICLGMQIMGTLGYEFGETEGLNIFNAETKPIQCSGSIPHMGFNHLKIINSNNLLKGIESEPFYFMHSYEVVNYTDVISLTSYKNHEFISSIAKNNIYGVQFHPEKSRDAGIQLFKNFITL